MARRTPSRPAARILAAELGKRGAFDSAYQEAYLQLVRTHSVLATGFAQLCKAHGISEPQYNTLRIVGGGGGGGRTMEEIAAAMVARDPDVTRLVDRLVRSGLVERCRSEEDRRVVMVHITAKGCALLRRLRDPVLELHESQLRHLPKSRLKALCASWRMRVKETTRSDRMRGTVGGQDEPAMR